MAEYIDLDTPLEVKVARGSTYEPYTSTLRELLDVNHIPYAAADVRPVVRGKWVQVMGKYDWMVKCSRCNGVPLETSNFCPNCGARMDGE